MTRSRIDILKDMEKLDNTWQDNKEKLNQLGKELEQYYIEAFKK